MTVAQGVTMCTRRGSIGEKENGVEGHSTTTIDTWSQPHPNPTTTGGRVVDSEAEAEVDTTMAMAVTVRNGSG